MTSQNTRKSFGGLPANPLAGGEGLAAPSPRTSSLALGPTGLASPTPTPKLVPTPLHVTTGTCNKCPEQFFFSFHHDYTYPDLDMAKHLAKAILNMQFDAAACMHMILLAFSLLFCGRVHVFVLNSQNFDIVYFLQSNVVTCLRSSLILILLQIYCSVQT